MIYGVTGRMNEPGHKCSHRTDMRGETDDSGPHEVAVTDTAGGVVGPDALVRQHATAAV
jgi:hypothetical protein